MEESRLAEPLLPMTLSSDARLFTKPKYQSSISAIFCIVCTMMGSGVVVLPYGFEKAGLGLGLALCLILGLMCAYTVLIYINNGRSFKEITDFSEHYFGKGARYLSFFASVFVLIGALIAYYLLMRDCLYYIGDEVLHWFGINNSSFWSEKTACYFICLIFPLVMMKKLNVLIKINSFGFLCLAFILFFIGFHGISAILGHAPIPVSQLHINYVAKDSYAVLMGILSLSFFVHNGIFAQTSTCNPATKKRDISISFFIVGLFYALVGSLGYFGFAYSVNGEIKDNFLNIFEKSNLFALSARLCLFLQLFTVYPILMFIIRCQVFEVISGSTDYPGFWKCLLLHGPLYLITLIMAVLDVAISDVLRYTGSIAALVVVFFLPVFVHWKVSKSNNNGKLTLKNILFHSIFLLVSLYVVLVQFFRPS